MQSAVRTTEPPTDLLSLIGHTPLIALRRLCDRDDIELFAKIESANPSGSAKMRSAYAMVQAEADAGRLRPGTVLVESSSGNLGVALAHLAILNDLKAHVVVDERTNPAIISTICALGAEVEVVADEPGRDMLAARLERVREIVEQTPGAVNLNQYANMAAIEAHRDGTMAEIADALDNDVSHVFVATSTTGTIGGCQALIRQRNLATTLIAVDALGSVLFDGKAGPRKLGGHGAGVVPALASHVQPDEVARASDLEAVIGARALARREAILAGASAGAVTYACLTRVNDLPPGSRVALILHDAGGPYLHTVYNDDWVASTLGVDADEVARRVDSLGR